MSDVELSWFSKENCFSEAMYSVFKLEGVGLKARMVDSNNVADKAIA